ncbi:hypothetical protein EMIT079MI2_340011 [Bacillus sp. IT-79MI2]
MLTLSNSDKLIKIKEQLAKTNCSAPMGDWRKIIVSTVLTEY